MPPKFSLQPVLDYRETRVEILEIELSRLMQAKQHGLIFLETLNNSRDRLLEELGHSQTGDIDLFMINQLRKNMIMVNERIVEQINRLRQLDEEVQKKQTEVINAKQDSEALSKLKEKEMDRFLKEEGQKENRMQDDIYISKAFRQSNGVA